MKKMFFIKLLFFVFSFHLFSQNTLSYSVYLIGDAGEDTVSGNGLLMLKDQLMTDPNSTVVFMGDNLYPNGLNTSRKSEKHLESQLSILKNYKGNVYFIPGNHDWAAQTSKGLKTLKLQEEYVNNYLKTKSTVNNLNDATFLPANGLPGPTSIMLNDRLRLIIIDTQWFLHSHKKNTIGSKKHTTQLFYFHLDSLLYFAKQNNEQVIITAHHPIYTNGEHSKSKQPWRFLINYTPFQLFGLLGINRLYSQDIYQPRYKKMRSSLLKSINKYDNIVYASGHEHNLQFFKVDNNRYIISGCGSKLTPLAKKKKFDSIFQDDTKTGFVRLTYYQTGNHVTSIFRTEQKELVLEGF